MEPGVPQRLASYRASLLGQGLVVFALLGSAGCFTDGTAERSPPPRRTFVPPEPEPEPEPLPEPEPYADLVAQLPPEWSEEEKVESLLLSYCGECHGGCSVGVPYCEGMQYIDDVDRLVQEGKILPGNPDESLLLQKMVDGSMPPGNYLDVPPELIERISAFIVTHCSVYEGACEDGEDGGG
jgi:hypothetical protein